MFGNFENIRIFRGILISYILILVIPLISGFLIYQVSIHKIKENATEKSENLLNQTKEMIDRKSEELQKVSYQLSLNPDINQLIYQKEDPHSNNGYAIYKVINSMKPFGYTNTLFQNFYIYFNDMNIILSPKSSYVRTNDFYEIYMYEDITYDDWMKNINQGYHSQEYLPATKMKIGGKAQSIITYMQSIPLDGITSQKANIIVLINEEEIRAPLNQISTQYGGSTFIHDDKGNIIIGDNMKDLKVSFDQSTMKTSMVDNEDEFIMIESKSNHNKWTYVAIIPKAKLAEDAIYIQKIHYFIAFITIMLGLCIAILFSYKHSIPLHRLLGIMSIPEIKKVKNPYDFIHSNVEEIIASNDDLKDQIEEQLPILQDTIIKKLVTGEVSSSRDVMTLIEQANIPLKGAFGYVGIMQIFHMFNALDKDMLNEMNVAQLVIQNELDTIFQGAVLYCNFDIDQVVFLVSYYKEPSQKEQKKLEGNLVLLLNRLVETYSLKVNIGMGKRFEQFTDIHQSYEEAKLSLPFIQSMTDKAAIYTYTDQFHEEHIDFYYPIEHELRLINAVMNGSVDEVKELLGKVYMENVEQRTLTQQEGSQIIAALNGTIMRLLMKNTQLQQVIIDDIHAQIEEISSKKIEFEKDMKQIRACVIKITQSIYEKRLVGSQRVIHKIKETIKNDFNNPDLSLHQISEVINLPEKMVPRIFKEHTGMNISDYIEDVRLNFARSKLIQTADVIEDIALQSGYNSGHSFRRAFKRSAGVSPSEFRNMMSNSKTEAK